MKLRDIIKGIKLRIGKVFGYTKEDIVDAGYVYAPYVPLYVTPLVKGPENSPKTFNSFEEFSEEFLPKKGLYGKRLRKEYYGTFVVVEHNDND